MTPSSATRRIAWIAKSPCVHNVYRIGGSTEATTVHGHKHFVLDSMHINT